MITIQGKGVSPGVAMGPLYFYRRAAAQVRSYTVTNAAAEWQRFVDARTQAVAELGQLAERARTEAGEEAALLFEVHQMLAEDIDFEDAVRTAIQSELRNAEAAVEQATASFAAMFAAIEDPYLQGRAADIQDVSRRIGDILAGVKQGGIQSDVPVILVADDLAPSETIQLDKSRILGFVTQGGSGSSHTAILARTMGIPAIAGVGEAIGPGHEGRQAIVDGATGAVLLDPNQLALTYFTKKQAEEKKLHALLAQLKGKENVTLDGKTMLVYCNIGTPEDVAAVLANDGGGIGLFRSEFLYLNSAACPTEEQQFQAYRKVLADMAGKEVVIRTLDIGADKQVDYLDLPKEDNPAMGLRALRLSLTRPELMRTQLRALYRASAHGRLSILLPMVTSLWEVREVRLLCEAVQRELRQEGLPFADKVPLGVMIETPAAALLSDRLAKEVDFFSIGTNDLTQYTLACDRQAGGLGRFYDPHHPAVLRMLKLVADNAHAAGIRVGICGELAADPEMTETFLALGIDELSVSPRMVLPLRSAIRNIDVGQCAGRCLAALE